ncbi:MAG: putative quinol monooxygenase [Candidatus Rokuibacteriota bacterium]
MIIVAGRIYVAPDRREAFLAVSLRSVIEARRARGCLDFVVAADPVEAGRVNVYEEWRTAKDLERFRGEGPEPELTQEILRAEVSRHEVASSGPA